MTLINSLQRLTYITIFFASGIILSGCNTSQQHEPDVTTHEINMTSASPSGGATAVARDSEISVAFAEELDANTVNARTISVRDDTSAVVEAERIEVSGNRVIFIPKQKLYPSSTYTVTLAAGLTGKGEYRLQNDISYQFTTRRASWGPPLSSAIKEMPLLPWMLRATLSLPGADIIIPHMRMRS